MVYLLEPKNSLLTYSVEKWGWDDYVYLYLTAAKRLGILMGMYCACGVKKRDGWKCQCDWKDWYLCFEMDHVNDGFPANIPIKHHPDKDGIYEVRTFSDGDYDEGQSEFSIIEKNWGQYTNQAISRWKVEYNDNWMGYKGVYAWKCSPNDTEF